MSVQVGQVAHPQRLSVLTTSSAYLSLILSSLLFIFTHTLKHMLCLSRAEEHRAGEKGEGRFSQAHASGRLLRAVPGRKQGAAQTDAVEEVL